MAIGSDPNIEPKFVVTNTLIVADIQRSVLFYRYVLGATMLREGELARAFAIKPVVSWSRFSSFSGMSLCKRRSGT